MLRACKSKGVLALASASVLSVMPASAADGPVEIVEGWIVQAQALEWLDVSHGGISHDSASDQTSITDLVISFGFSDLPTGQSDDDDDDDESETVDLSYAFTVPSIVFQGLETDGDYYRAVAVRADTVEIDFAMEGDSQTSSTSTGAYQGLSATNLRWARWPDIADDPERPISRYYPLAAALVDVSFDEMSFEGLEIVSETEPAYVTTMHYGPGLIGPTAAGNVSAMTIGEITVTGRPAGDADPSEDAGMAFDLSIEGVEAETYNYGDMVRLFDPDLDPGTAGDAFEQVVGYVSARNWTVSSAGVEFTMADARIEDIGARRPAVALLDRADELYVRTVEDGGEPDPVELVELVSAAYGVFRLGLAESRDMEFTSDMVSGTFEAGGIAGVSSDGIESIYYRDFEAMDDDELHVRLGDFTISDIGFPSLAALVLFEEAQESGDVDTMLAAMPTLGGISISDLLVNVPFLAELSLDSAVLEMADHIGPIPTRIRSAIDSLRLPTWMLDDETFETFEALGYETVGASHDLDLAWEEVSQTLALAASAALEDGGVFTLDATLGGLPREAFENPMNAPFLMFMLTLVEASAEFVDDSLTERALEMFAEQNDMDSETMKAQALGILPFMLGSLQRPNFMTMVTTAARTFLENPGNISIRLSPDAPIPLMQLMEASESDPGMVVDMLNMKVTAQ